MSFEIKLALHPTIEPILRIAQAYDTVHDEICTRIYFGWSNKWMKFIDLHPVPVDKKISNKEIARALHEVAKELEATQD